MGLLDKLLGHSPYEAIVEHTRKVHECVELVRPLVEALLQEDYETLEELHHEMSRLEHEADDIKNAVRKHIARHYLLGVGRDDLNHFLAKQDDVADAAEDFAVVLILRRTRIHPELKEDFTAFAGKVIDVSDRLLEVAEGLVALAESAFAGPKAQQMLEAVEDQSQMEWEADKLQRRFARHYYEIEQELDPVTIMVYDKICHTLSDVANSAEGAGKHLRNMIEGK